MDAERLLIRQITPDEIEVFRRIRLEALEREPASFASRHGDWMILSDDEWRLRLNDPVFVAFNESEPVGIMGLLRSRPRKMAHRAVLVMVYIRKEFRRTGLAKALLERIVDFAKDEGISQIELGVSAENAGALRFYNLNGFFEIGRVPGGFLDEGGAVDEVVMMRPSNL